MALAEKAHRSLQISLSHETQSLKTKVEEQILTQTIVPPTFDRVDFTNFSYGQYEKSSGKKIKLIAPARDVKNYKPEIRMTNS